MKDFLRKKKGFTLTELLVVIALVGLLAGLAVAGYVQYRKNAILDLSADNLISFTGQAKSNTIYGVDGSKCFGLKFEKQGNEYFLYRLEYDFDNRKVWSGEDWVYIGCDDDTEQKQVTVLDRSVKIGSLNLDDVEVEDFSLRFIPPDGEMEIFDGKEFLIVEINYVNSETDYRKVKFDLKTKNVFKVR